MMPCYPKVKAQSATLLAALLALPSAIDGHGHLKSPRSRNYVAYKDGKWWPQLESDPLIETEPQSASSGGLCGIISGKNYNYPKNALGGLMRWNPQACYAPGQTIDLTVELTAHHQGHFEFHACPIQQQGQAPTEECFAAHPLTFVSEVLSPGENRAPAVLDANYPERAYVYNSDSELHYKFQLPSGLDGEYVLLQWHYITANAGCTHVGYEDYAWPVGWLKPGNVPCNTAYVNAEQFWNCAEVEISNDCGSQPTTGNPTTSKPTTSRPTTSAPTTSKPTTGRPTAPTTAPSTASPTEPPTTTPTATQTTATPTTATPTVTATPRPTSSPTLTAPADTKWYPDENGAVKCKNDGLAPSWLHNKYASQSTCCTTHFSWSYHACMGTKPASSYKWYVDWATSTCKQDCETTAGGSCGGLVAGAWVLLHDSLEKCCQVHVSWNVNSCLGL